MSFDGAFFKRTQASCFFLERLRISTMIQSGSLILGAGGRDSPAFRMEKLKVSHTEFMVEVCSELSKVSAKTD